MNINVLCSGVNEGASVIDSCLSSFRGIALTTPFRLGKVFASSVCGDGEQFIGTGVSLLNDNYGLAGRRVRGDSARSTGGGAMLFLLLLG